MTSNSDPWADIPAAPVGKFSRRRIDAQITHEIFWLRDESGNPGLLIEVSRNISHASLKEAKINIRDLLVDVIDIADERIRALIIRLTTIQSQDIFQKLCLDLIEHAARISDGSEVFFTICNRLKKWQALFSGRSKTLLSANEIQGLYTELYFIADTLTKNRTWEDRLIRGWEGPNRTQQDFILGDQAVEIKSITGNQRGKVRISSEDQLDSHLEKLYLQIYFLSEHSDCEKAESLNAIVRRITSIINNKGNRDIFDIKLQTAHYIDIQDYDTPCFRVKSCSTYLVTEDFPRITRKSLPEGVETVSYNLILSSIEIYRSTLAITGD